MSNNDTPVIVTSDVTFAMTAMGLANDSGLLYAIIRSAPPAMLAGMVKHMIAVFVDDLPDREGFVRAVKEKHGELNTTAKQMQEYIEERSATTASEELANILRKCN